MKKFDALSYIIGDAEAADRIVLEGGWPSAPFAEEVIDFLACWSDKIRHVPAEKKDPAAAAFGFWCRRAGTVQMSRDYTDISEGYSGRGICLQFVPNNIPALFAYSLAAGLLSGNSVIMRLPERFECVSPLIETLKAAWEQCPDVGRKIVLIKYPHDQQITDWLSGLCDIRIIWGGNSSIASIQKSKNKEGARDIVFPDRHSAAVISAKAVIEENDLSQMLKGFFNDTYLNDQNACSSPNIIYWLGNESEVALAKTRFWKELSFFLKGKYEVQEETAVKKYEQAMLMAGLDLAEKIDTEERNVVRVSARGASKELWKYAANGGFFIECSGQDLQGLEEMLNENCQTIAVYGGEGDSLLEKAVREAASSHGSFRTVQMGHTLDFSLIWDGQDLIRQMVRKL